MSTRSRLRPRTSTSWLASRLMVASTWPAKVAARSRTYEKNGAGPKSRAAVTRAGSAL